MSKFDEIVAHSWPASNLRILALSATMPNADDVAAWIGAPPECTVSCPATACTSLLRSAVAWIRFQTWLDRAAQFSLDSSFRPVPLTLSVIGYPRPEGQNDFLFERSLGFRVFDVVVKYSEGGCAWRVRTRAQLSDSDRSMPQAARHSVMLARALYLCDSKLGDIVCACSVLHLA